MGRRKLKRSRGEISGSLFTLVKRTPQGIGFPNGETLEEVRARTMEALKKLVAKHPNEAIALVAHRVHRTRSYVVPFWDSTTVNFWRIQQDTASTNLFIYKNAQWLVSFLNDTSYLKVLGENRPCPIFSKCII